MALQLPMQEQEYSPEKSLLVVSIHRAPIRPATIAERQRTAAAGGGAAPPAHQEERRGCSRNNYSHQENNELSSK